MKPTEVQSGGSGNQPATATNQAPSNNSNQYPTQDGGSGRDFPHFQTNFGFRPHFDDMFDDDDFGPHLRARMRRDPFAAFGGRKRCGFMPFDDPYRHYFADESDLFPGFNDPEWDTMRTGRRRNTPQPGGAASTARGNIFDHIPPEFRNYIPENFGFHQPVSQEYSQSYPPQQQHFEGYPQQQPPQQHPPQQYQGHAEQPHQQQYYEQPQQASRPKYCDASIQTDHDIDPETQNTHLHQNLNQHNLRNTMDFGQKAPQEGSNETRSHSAPPVNKRNYASASASAHASPGNTQATYYASTGTDPQTPQQYVGQPMPDVYQQKQQPHHPPPPPQRQHIPPQYKNCPPQQQYTQQQAAPRGSQPAQNDGGFVRHVPIFIEGRSDPVRHPAPSAQQHEQQQPRMVNPQQPQFSPGVEPQQQQYHQQQQFQRPTPLNTQEAQAHAQANPEINNQAPPENQEQVPQTPQTTQCINKIQDIQRDVLNLLSQVEQFAGKKQDREYLYLDEMLTRNLLKLDTIDTNGKDSIRLARREAIKCIQASINVLEAKAEENAKTAQASVMETEKSEDEKAIPLPYSETQLAEDEKHAACHSEVSSNVVAAPEETGSVQETGHVDTEQEIIKEELKDTVQGEQTEAPTAERESTTVETQPINSSDKTEQVTNSAEQITEPNTELEPTKPLAPSVEEATSLEPSKEQIEKSSSEKENKPPGSPKKKIVRKVKKVASDKKATSSTGDLTPDQSTTPPSQEAVKESVDEK